MIILKPIHFYDNFSGCEATWVDKTQLPDLDVPEAPATFDIDGNELTAVIAAHTTPGAIIETQVKSHSYHPTQMDILRADALSFNTPLTEYDSLINQIETNYVEPTAAPVVVPQVITIRQAKLALHAVGLLDDVDAAVANADRATQIEWEYATEVHRDWQTLIAMQTAMSLTDEMVDSLFINGAIL